MTRAAMAAVAIAVAAGMAGCREPAPADPHAEAAKALMAAYEPLATCVSTGLRDRAEFDGNLGEFLVNSAQDLQLQAIARRYLGSGTDLGSLSHPERVAEAERTMMALARYAGEPVPGPDGVKRVMAMVEAMNLTAVATGVDCPPSETLESLMTKAEHEYL